MVFTSGSRESSWGSNPLLKNNVKGFNPKYKIIFESGVKYTGNALYFSLNVIFKTKLKN